MKGMEIGYLYLSPFAALTDAMITQTSSRTARKIRMGIPTIMKHRGNASTIYRSIDIWKFRDALPFSLTQADSSFFDSQQISGPIIPPKGKK
jgi:hypothetical protein